MGLLPDQPGAVGAEEAMKKQEKLFGFPVIENPDLDPGEIHIVGERDEIQIHSLPYQPHSEESKEAAKLAEPKAGTQRAEILKLLRLHAGRWGYTDDDIQRYLGLNANTERPRRIELVRAGLVEKNPDQTGTSAKGRKAALWRAV